MRRNADEAGPGKQAHRDAAELPWLGLSSSALARFEPARP
jgi:hypothetical protein